LEMEWWQIGHSCRGTRMVSSVCGSGARAIDGAAAGEGMVSPGVLQGLWFSAMRS